MTTTKTWSFALGFENYTFTDQSIGGSSSSSRSHISGAITTTMSIPTNPPNDRQGIGLHTSPTLNVPIVSGDTIAFDFGPVTGDQTVSTFILTATYTDVTTESQQWSGVSGSGTRTLTLTQSKTLDFFTIRFSISAGGIPTPARTAFRDLLEVRLTTVSAAAAGEYNMSLPLATLSGENVSAMGISQSGTFLFFALENGLTGFPIILKVDRPVTTTPTTANVYEPGAGTNANIAGTGDPDRMVFHGNFGTDVGVIDHVISTIANNDISPTSIGAKVIHPLRVDIPSDVDHIVAINKDDQDAIETDDGGSNWSTLNAALGQTVHDMSIDFFGVSAPFLATFGGDDGVDENLEYSPNEFVSLREDTSAALKAVGAIVSVDASTEGVT